MPDEALSRLRAAELARAGTMVPDRRERARGTRIIAETV